MPPRTRPFRQFVVKVHSRCDLACDHCYVYRHADQSWRGRPPTMSDETFRRTAARIAEHAGAHGLARVHVVFHGGEPLLAGRERLRGFARELRAALDGVSGLDLRMQTNGLRLDDAFCAMLAEEEIVTAVSLDGDRSANDRHRIRADGSGSYASVVRAIRRIGAPAHRRAFGGLLCTVDVTNDPVAVYRTLAGLDPPGIDFLLPHATWDRPPPRRAGATEYADWLIAVHRRWTADGRPVRIRIFESITRLAHGGISLTEALGLGSSDLLVVETDGAVEQADWLKTVAEGAPATGFHVARDSFDRAAGHPGILAQRQGLDGLAAQCRACPVVAVCGGGLYAHRFRTPPRSAAGQAFDNPSVYCADLLKLIEYVAGADTATATHGLRPGHFDELAAGFGGAAAVRELARSQSGLRRVLLAAAHDTAARYDPAARYASAAGAPAAPDPVPAPDPAAPRGTVSVDGTPAVHEPAPRPAEPHEPPLPPPPSAAWRAVLALSPAALETALADPWIRPWALAARETGPGDPGRPAEIALSAATRAGEPLTLTVPTRCGTVHLPGLGLLTTDGTSPTLTITTGGGRFRVHDEARDTPADRVRWQPLRHLEADGVRIALEDLDPYRCPFPTGAAPRQTDAEHRHWQELFHEAWRIVRTDFPRHAGGVAAALTAVVPLSAAPGAVGVETSRHAFGAIGITPPSSAGSFARLLIEGCQHLKLDALADLYDLLAPGGGSHRVAWSAKPLPLETVLRQTYTRLALGDRGTGPRRAELLDALDTLAGAGAPTAVGARLLAGMRTTARALGTSC